MKKNIFSLLIGCICGCSGFIFGRAYEKTKVNKVDGYLHVDASDNKNAPKIFLVLTNEDVISINSSDYVTLKVQKKKNNENA